MPAILQNMTSGLSETLVYVAIALVTLVGVLKCIYPALRNGVLLNRAVAKLERHAGDSPAVWREARFLGRSLRPEWQRFLLNAKQLDMRGIPCSTEEYVNEDSVIYNPGHSQLAELIPSLLTSLGILGTFLGLMEGLTSVNFTDAAGTIESIPSLLGGMRFAFATSVVGISCSICFNIVNRIVVGHAFKALDSFDEAFYELAMPRPLDADVQLLCQKQDGEADIQRAADNIGHQLASAVEMAVGRATQPLAMSIDNLLKGVTREQMDGVQRIVGQFVQQMNASMSGQFLAMGETLKAVNQGQQAVRDNMQRTAQAAQTLSQQIDRLQEPAREALGGEALERLQASLDTLCEQQRRQTEALERPSARADMTEASGRDTLNTELEAVTISLAQLKVALDDLNGRVHGLRAEPDQPYDATPPVTEQPPKTPARRGWFHRGA